MNPLRETALQYSLDKIRQVFMGERKPPRILLIDDDPDFGRIMSKFSERANVPITVCATIGEVDLLHLSNFDIAIVDYDLRNISGIQLMQVLASRGSRLYAVLISAYPQPPIPNWASRIMRFVPKSIGPMGILATTLLAYHRTMLFEEERRSAL